MLLRRGIQVVVLPVPQLQRLRGQQRGGIGILPHRAIFAHHAFIVVDVHRQLHGFVIEGHRALGIFRAAFVTEILPVKGIVFLVRGIPRGPRTGLQHDVLPAVSVFPGNHVTHHIAGGNRSLLYRRIRIRRRHPVGSAHRPIRITQTQILVLLRQLNRQIPLVAVQEPVPVQLQDRAQVRAPSRGHRGPGAQHGSVHRQVVHLVVQHQAMVIECHHVVVFGSLFGFVRRVLALVPFNLNGRLADQCAAHEGLFLAHINPLVPVAFPQHMVHGIERIPLFHRNRHREGIGHGYAVLPVENQ